VNRTVSTGKRNNLWAKLTDLREQELHPTRRTPCRDEDPEVFFPFPGDARGIAKAKAICNRCTVKTACGEWALETRQADGVWGGLSEAEREDIRMQRAGRGRRARAGRGVAA
jgi:WhiB family transcriptional regulator, redox-sensing transcriptional regulator